ncbi:MAG: proton-translocating transhydrogenase family protein [Planctomycetales bacterium]|nr:proton-translocating transhydrogenase family protein [Planctomycetales bacterium]
MKQQHSNQWSFVFLAGVSCAAVVGLLATSLLAQPAGKSGAAKVGEAVKPAAAAKTGDKATAKPKEDAPKAAPPKAELPKTEPPKAEPPKAEAPPAVPDPAEKTKPAAKPAKTADHKEAADEKGASDKEHKGKDHLKRDVDYSALLFVFAMATFIGLGVVSRVSRLLHTPLMSLTNAISAIAIVGAIIVTGTSTDPTIRIMGAVALFASMTNVVSGFLITDRMLKMFKQTRTEGK